MGLRHLQEKPERTNHNHIGRGSESRTLALKLRRGLAARAGLCLSPMLNTGFFFGILHHQKSLRAQSMSPVFML